MEWSQPIKIEVAAHQGISEAAIQSTLAGTNNHITIDYRLSSIGVTNSYLNIISDYLEASYIAEELGRFARQISCTQLNERYSRFCRFEIEVENVVDFARRFCSLASVLSEDQDEQDVVFAHSEKLREYTSSLEDRTFRCPELVDDYYANLINGAYYEMDDEYEEGYLEDEYQKYPERRFGFWKSAYSNSVGMDFYVSSDGLILDRAADWQGVLACYREAVEDAISDARFFSIGKTSYLVNEQAVVRFSLTAFEKAQRCAKALLARRQAEEMMKHSGGQLDVWGENWRDNLLFDTRENLDLRYSLSTPSNLISITNQDWRFVFFPEDIKSDEALALYSGMSLVFADVASFAGIGVDIAVNWDLLDDAAFEELCYDILYHMPRFNNRTIRKLGKTRSRDGGRDIEIYTHAHPGRPPMKFIYQCKLTRSGSSLTTTKVRNISDTLVQYGAQGYGLMTNVVIDAVLFDRVDAICGRAGVEQDHWSKQEIERFMARHPNLRDRHFRNATAFTSPSHNPIHSR